MRWQKYRISTRKWFIFNNFSTYMVQFRVLHSYFHYHVKKGPSIVITRKSGLKILGKYTLCFSVHINFKGCRVCLMTKKKKQDEVLINYWSPCQRRTCSYAQLHKSQLMLSIKSCTGDFKLLERISNRFIFSNISYTNPFYGPY